MRKIIAIWACALLLAACGKKEGALQADTGDPQYQLGYDMGHADGVMEAQAELCRRIESQSSSMAEALRNEKFCPQNK
jgi:hypothetical protein